VKVKIGNRALTLLLTFPDYDFDVERYSHHAVGGPKQARIRVKGNDIDLWKLVEYLRCPIKIYSEEGDAVWWGYIAHTEAIVRGVDNLTGNYVRVGATVETMYNKVAVAYNKVDVTTGIMDRDTTTWADDEVSQTEYGIRELLWSASAATQTHAEAARDAKLSQVKYPQAIITPQNESTPQGMLICHGWWDTLGWQYYANDGTVSVDTATQAGTIINAAGQFFTGIDQDVTSGISIRETRDGDGLAIYEANQLLAMGTNNFRRILVRVDENRRVRIYEEPSRVGLMHYLTSDGSILDQYGQRLRKSTCPVAVWARWKDVIPSAVNTSLLADPGVIFIEQSEYDVKTDKLTILPRGDLSPWEFPLVKDG
jgi:hypothetical protein